MFEFPSIVFCFCGLFCCVMQMTPTKKKTTAKKAEDGQFQVQVYSSLWEILRFLLESTSHSGEIHWLGGFEVYLHSTHSHSPAPSTTTNPPPLTQPLASINHYKLIHHHKPSNHQQNPFINHQQNQNPFIKIKIKPNTGDKIKTQHRRSWSWCFEALALMVAAELG